MKKLVAAFASSFVLGLCAAPAALAQVTTSAATPARVSAESTAAVVELLEVMKYRELMRDSFAQMQKTMPAMMAQNATQAITTNGALSAEEKKAALARLDKELPEAAAAFNGIFDDPKLMDELIAETVPLYARHFTVAEVRQMAEFYRSPVGRKMLAKLPEITSEAMQVSQKIVMPRIAAVMQKLTQGKK